MSEPNFNSINSIAGRESKELYKVTVRNFVAGDIKGSACEIDSSYSQTQIQAIEEKVANLTVFGGDLTKFLQGSRQ